MTIAKHCYQYRRAELGFVDLLCILRLRSLDKVTYFPLYRIKANEEPKKGNQKECNVRGVKKRRILFSQAKRKKEPLPITSHAESDIA
ncbi:hypothetical protein HMPREF1869_00593 [Bacteroidales bacterium KA00251]|nr:hypothetical protein HMPREF1869_00593 [Bacteroidales bacterium KA00251]